MSALARTALEDLLHARKLGTALWTAPEEGPRLCVAATEVEQLDAELAGGWPRGQVSELVAPLSTGASWVACLSLAAATRRGELAALIDPLDMFDPESSATAGFVWPYFLWVRGDGVRGDGRLRVSGGGVERHDRRRIWTCVLERSVKALALVLQTEGFGVVVLDWLAVPPAAMTQLPWTTWRRLQRLVEGRETACLVLQRAPQARSAGGVTVTLTPSPSGRADWRGHSDQARRFAGVAGQARVIRAAWHATTLHGFTWTSASTGIRAETVEPGGRGGAV